VNSWLRFTVTCPLESDLLPLWSELSAGYSPGSDTLRMGRLLYHRCILICSETGPADSPAGSFGVGCMAAFLGVVHRRIYDPSWTRPTAALKCAPNRASQLLT
jgi:hypothetical protein